jgi:hypothetical protein
LISPGEAASITSIAPIIALTSRTLSGALAGRAFQMSLAPTFPAIPGITAGGTMPARVRPKPADVAASGAAAFGTSDLAEHTFQYVTITAPIASGAPPSVTAAFGAVTAGADRS